MNIRIVANLLAIITSTTGILIIGSLYSKLFVKVGVSIPISEFLTSLAVTFIALSLLGFSITTLISKIYSDWDSLDTKFSTFGVFLGILFYLLITTRACLPAIFMTIVYTSVALIPFKFGSKIAEYFLSDNSSA